MFSSLPVVFRHFFQMSQLQWLYLPDQREKAVLNLSNDQMRDPEEWSRYQKPQARSCD